MTFNIVYKTVNIVYLGKTFVSSHTIESAYEIDIKYQSDCLENVFFDEATGDFTIDANEIGKISFIITITSSSGCGYKIPINIEIIDKENETTNLQYYYNTSYSFFFDISIKPSDVNENNAYSLVGAPSGIYINTSTGELCGFSTVTGKFVFTITALDSQTGEFLGSNKIILFFHTYNKITSITFSPGSGFMGSTKIPLTLTCNYQGESPNFGEIFTISSRAISSYFLADYKASNEMIFIYIVNLSNNPGSYPITITDENSGYFITSSDFVLTAACFNQDTTILISEDGKEIYKEIKDLNIGDEVSTYKHGLKKITHIGSNIMINNPESITDCMYKLIKTQEYPDLSHDLILLGRHSILVDELTPKQKKKINEIHPVDRIDDKCLLNTMFNEDFKIINDTNEYTYYHLVLEKEKDKIDRRYGIYVNGGEIIAATTYKKDFIKQFINKI